MTMADDLKEHDIFIKATNKFIKDCLDGGAPKDAILDSFDMIIEEVIKERLK